MHQLNKTSSALIAIGLLSLTALNANAQQPTQQPQTPTPPQKIEKIEVTGSNIKRIDAEAVSPVQVITRSDIERSGRATIAEVLRDIPQNGGQSFNETFTNSFSPGASGIALRGLSQKSTLVLINGRRMASYGLAQNLFDTYVDLNSIPTSAVDRIEILKDGASAVYGSDAIAGVVNIILRRDFRGGEIGANFGTSYEGGLNETRANAGFGFGDLSSQRFNVLATFDYFKRDELKFSDRKFTEKEDYRAYPGGTLGWITYGAYATGTGLLTRVPIAGCPAEYLVQANQLNPALNGTTCAYNAATQQSLFPATERLGFLGRATVEFTPSLQGFAELSLSSNETRQTFTPAGIGNTSITFDPVTNGVRGISNILPVGNPSNPFTTPTRIIYTFNDVGTRDSKINTDSGRLLLGLKGNISAWDWEAAVVGARSETDQVNFNRVNAAVVQQAIASGTYNFITPASGTVTANQLRINPRREAESKLTAADFKVSSELAQLPGGALGFAAGVDHRKESLDDKPDPLLTGGFVLGQGSTFTKGERTSTAVFVELSAPITKQIEMQVAARNDRYSDFGAATSPKFGLKWNISKDFLARFTVGRGFRAPTLPEASVSNNVSFNTVNDPAFNNAAFTVGALSISNPNLKPEKSRNANLGLVWEPSRDLALGLDMYRIEQNDIVSRETANSIVRNAFLGNPLYTSLVVRNAATNNIIYIIRQVRNFAQIETSGADIDFRWRFASTPMGKFTLSGNWNYLRTFKGVTVPGATATDFVDSNGLGSNPRYRGNTTLAWEAGDWNTSMTYRYIHSYDQQFVAAQSRIGAYKDVDLFVAYSGFKGLRLTASVRSLLNTLPPWDGISQGNGGHDFTLFDRRGRYMSVGATYTFK
jgi:iron complex outermembrane recepter protein